MKANKPFRLLVPVSVKNCLEIHLKETPPDFKYDVFEFHLIINYLLYKQVNLKPDEEFFNINHTYLKSIITSKTDKYIKYLLNGEFIIRDFYIRGEKSYHYKLNPKFELDLNTVSIEPGNRLFNKILKRNRIKRAHFNRLEPHLLKMKNMFMDLQFDYEAAENYVAETQDIKKQIAYFFQIKLLADKRLRYFSRNKTNNRLYTPVTNLKKELRSFVIGDLVNIDLKNSQPFFLGQLMIFLTEMASDHRNREINKGIRDINNNTILCGSFLKFDLIKTFGIKAIKSISKIHQKQNKSNLVNLEMFADWVNSGNLYEYVRNYFDGEYERDTIKDIMFKVLFSKNVDYINFKKIIPYEREKKIFAEVFPTVAEMVKILKNKDHTTLPILLQKIESYIFIDCIAKVLVNTGIVPITIHDSIIVERQHKDKAIEIIHDVFAQSFNVIPLFHEDSIRRDLQSDNNDTAGHIKKKINGCRICPVTGMPIHMQKENSRLLSNTGLKWLRENNPESYDLIKRRFLPRRGYSGVHTQFEKDEICHLSKQIRNEHYGPRRKKVANSSDQCFSLELK